jgi:putative two-component system response regulator
MPDFKHARVLVVDDRPSNVMLLEDLLGRWGYTNVITTTVSSEVVDLCREVEPDLVLLDLMMPDPDGFKVMELLENETRGAARLPILVLTADISRDVRRRALAAGARDFVSKPFDPDEVELRVGNLLETRRLQLELERQNVILDYRVRARTRDLEQSRLDALERLALVADYHDTSTYEHTARVGRTAAQILTALGGDAGEVWVMRSAAPLHDIGNIGIPDSILLKSGRLTPDEYELMKQHTIIGAQILAGGGSPLLKECEKVAATHHERWDGTGYPAGLAGEDIPLSGRVTALADVFDALTHDRPYKEAWTLEAAVAEIARGSGTAFDPAVVDAFMGLSHGGLLAPIDPADQLSAVIPEPAGIS